VKHLQFFVRKKQQTNEQLQVVVYQEKSHIIHVWYVFIYMWSIFMVNVGKFILVKQPDRQKQPGPMICSLICFFVFGKVQIKVQVVSKKRHLGKQNAGLVASERYPPGN